MADAKFFARGKVQEFREELLDDKKDPKFTKKRIALKKIVANMTIGNDMSPLFPDVMACVSIADLEIKKMVYLFMINYAKAKPDLVNLATTAFAKDVVNPDPLIRALALRTMSNVQVQKAIEAVCDPLVQCCSDRDPYVRKTAALCIPKVYFFNKELAKSKNLLQNLRTMLNDSNATVVANALAAVVEINDKSDDFDFSIEISTAGTLVAALTECAEWYQSYILEALIFVKPERAGDAESIIERLLPRLQHQNSGVLLATVKVVMYLLNYCNDQGYVETIYAKIGPPLITLASGEPEIQYVAMRNILLIVQKCPDILKDDMKVFFCKYNDPIYVKLAKLEIMFRLVTEFNVHILLAELKEYATEVDVDFVRKSVRSIGRCAIKIKDCTNKCVETLVELIQTKVNYVVQEAIVVIRDIFRKYPNQYESIISVLCENLDELDEPEAKASMIWIIGHYADRIENSSDLLEGFIDSFLEEPADTQLAILTSTVKLFLKRPAQAQELVPKVLKWATEEVDNPDVRDRGFIYWRLLSADPVTAKAIIFSEESTIQTESDNIDAGFLEHLLLYIDTYIAVTHKPVAQMFPGLKPRKIFKSTALSARVQAAIAFGDSKTSNELHAAPVVGGAGPNPYGANDWIPESGATAGAVYGFDTSFGQQMMQPQMTGFDQRNSFIQPQPTGMIQPQPTGMMFPQQTGMGGGCKQQPMVQPQPTGYNQRNSFIQPQPTGMIQPQPTGMMFPQQTGMGGGFQQQQQMVQPQQTGFQQQRLSIGSNPAQDLYALAAETSYVAPKQLYLSANMARGMEITGTFSRRNGMISMDLTIINRALQTLSDFIMQLNKNTFGFMPGPLNVRTHLPPNQSIEVSVPMQMSQNNMQPTSPINALHVAVKNNVGVFFFQCAIPVHVMLTEDGQITQNEYLQQWQETESTAAIANIDGISNIANIDAFKKKLIANNLYLVGERQSPDEFNLFFSGKINGQVAVLVEIRVDSGTMPITYCGLQARCRQQGLLPIFLDSLSLVLKAPQM